MTILTAAAELEQARLELEQLSVCSVGNAQIDEPPQSLEEIRDYSQRLRGVSEKLRNASSLLRNTSQDR